MIRNVNKSNRIKVKPHVRLQPYFVALARKLVAWRNDQGRMGDEGVAVGVTSSHHKSGCSTVALNLANALADLTGQPVLFVETEHRPNGLSRRLKRSDCGLEELLQGRESTSKCIYETNHENLFLLPPGKASGKAMSALPVEALDSLVPEILCNFSYLIADLPVATPESVTFPVLERMDGAVLVKSGQSMDLPLNRVVKSLKQSGTPIIGLVLNKT